MDKLFKNMNYVIVWLSICVFLINVFLYEKIKFLIMDMDNN